MQGKAEAFTAGGEEERAKGKGVKGQALLESESDKSKRGR